LSSLSDGAQLEKYSISILDSLSKSWKLPGFFMIEYHLAEDIDVRVKEILWKLKMTHIDETRVICLRSKGSGSRRVIARCHGLARIMQLALNKKPHYVIEVLSERFDQLNKEDQTKVLIHEILHIPHSFGGGFRSHKPFVTRAKVQRMYDKFIRVEKI